MLDHCTLQQEFSKFILLSSDSELSLYASLSILKIPSLYYLKLS